MSALWQMWSEPLYFLGLLALPLLVWRVSSLTARGRVPVPTARAVTGLPSLKATLWWLPDALRILAITAIIAAAARPTVAGEATIVGEGVDIMLVLDMSSSMNAIDGSRQELLTTLEAGDTPDNRFDVARDILKQFIVNRNAVGHDRLGLAIFGHKAWLKYPLAHDHARLIRSLNELILDDGRRARRSQTCGNRCTIDGGGTAIGDALGRSFNQLSRSSSDSKIVVLITDGKQQGGTLDARAIARHIRDLPAEDRVRVYTFLVGGKDEVWLPAVDRFGRPSLSADGTPRYERPSQPFPTDPELLQEIASLTGGKFYLSYNEAKFKEDVEDLERTVFSAEVQHPDHDVFFYPLLAALLLLAAEWALRLTLFRSVA